MLLAHQLRLLCYFVLATQAIVAWAAGHGHRHSLHHLHTHLRCANTSVSPVETQPTIASLQTGSKVSEAALKVSKALDALAVVNELRLDNLKRNNYTFTDSKRVTGEQINAPPLDYSTETIKKLSASVLQWDTSFRVSSIASEQSFIYTIPSDLAEAVCILAESEPPSPVIGEETALVASIHAKYNLRASDTNRPAQKL